MEEKTKIYTIDDLLNSLQNPEEAFNTELPNNLNTWERIGNKDVFDELGLDSSELDNFLIEWVNDNDYNNLI